MISSQFCGTGILPVFRLTIALLSLIASLSMAIAPFNMAIAAPLNCPDGMAFIPKGTFNIGSETYYASEAPASDVTVDSFCIDRHEVTNAEYRQFVEATGYQTVAERPIPKDQFPDLTEEQRQPGSLVFWPPESLQQMTYLSWWHWVVGANWQHPYGSASTLEGLDDYPAVHIA
ncbi:MAG: SUMF1/EgtB/PvdO family nonheme iron enzyme, partial [Cyanobacteria bacterium P01_E01_bin.42]